MKIFGREPAVIVGFLQAAIVLVGLLLNLSTDQLAALGLVVIAVGDLYVAYVTHHTLFGVASGLIKAVIAVFAAWGIDASPELTAALIGLSSASLSLFQRTQTSPLEQGNFDLAT